MNFQKILLVCFIVSICNLALAQNITVKGRIVDNQTNLPLENATIKITKNNKAVAAAMSNTNGAFEILVNTDTSLWVSAEFIGFQKYISKSFLPAKNIDLGIIKLLPNDKLLDELTVKGEKNMVELSLDKKVFNVGKDLANTGGTAQDILSNIPSVSVDPEGTVKLRGEANVRILIDGKPSGLVNIKGGAGLRQLQGNMVDKVEIITNPSAKYDAEGTSGIINIILKKDIKQGFNGSFDIITGNPTNFGLTANLNYRHKKINFFVNYGIAYRRTNYMGNVYQEVKSADTTRILRQDASGNLKGFDNNIRAGIEYYFTEKNILTASYFLSRADSRRFTENTYHDFIFTTPIDVAIRTQNEKEIESVAEYSLSYKKLFERKNKEFNVQLKYLYHWENSDQVFNQNGTLTNGKIDSANTYYQTAINPEFEKQYFAQVDYTQPFSKKGKIEIGTRNSYRNMINDYTVNTYRNNIAIPVLNNYFIYQENINAVYAIISNSISKIEYQFGLRNEFTNIKTELRKTHEVNPRTYNNLFPSAHFGYKIDKNNALQISYSKRIRRPVYDDLSPFMTVSDSRNFFSGNPNLNPSYTDSYEIGYLNYFKYGTISSSIYYRNTQNVISSIRTVDSQGFATTLPQNLNSEKDLGVEFVANYNIKKWWKADNNFNFFHANIDGTNIDPLYKTDTYTWFLKHTSRFILPKNWDAQIRGSYQAAQKNAQGSQQSIYFVDFSLKKEILNKKGSINFSVLDVFNSRWIKLINHGSNFYVENNRLWRTRQINLSFTYKIKNS